MPTYEYQCEACGSTFDKVMKISEMYEPEKDSCEACGEHKVKKKILSGVIFNADVVKPNAAFQERIKDMAKHHPLNTLKV